MCSPVISIIVPIYKTHKAYLLKCLTSLIEQTADAIYFEILLIDDNNFQDETGTICEEFASMYENCVVYHKENGGVSSARNLGIKKAKGEFLCFLDADDWLECRAVETMVRAIEKESDLDLLLFSLMIHFPDKQIKNQFWHTSNELFTEADRQCLQLQHYAKGITDYYPQFLASGNHGKLYRRSVVIQHNLTFNEQLTRMEDNLFNLYFVEYAKKIMFIDSVVHDYRKNSESVTNRPNTKIIEEFEKAYREIEIFHQKFDKPSIYDEALVIKRLVGIHIYYDSFWKIATEPPHKNQLNELLQTEPYHTCLKKVNYTYLTPKEKVYITVLKTKNYTLLSLLHKLETFYINVKGQAVNKNN
ncbi:glycosyltransferase family 2 protein [Enterococcus ureasiticus]|uniref:Glycosyltransferase 2-like domain-containing protein n=1 Tax=Enterococcus ureasiticus TaxID=903984 RepID=A0A1E5GGX2_9ENTE|nr:glycosyltransferase family 2 protein [Enterococcus ureasiticus]OEG11962.1 hypothetical protein BCR21_06920 [Enterococcus ureasiticus]